jgi:hypothetical protein
MSILRDHNALRDLIHFRRTHAISSRLKRFSESEHLYSVMVVD